MKKFVFLSSGLIPRLLGDILSLWICNLLAHLINAYAIDDSVRHLFYAGWMDAWTEMDRQTSMFHVAQSDMELEIF